MDDQLEKGNYDAKDSPHPFYAQIHSHVNSMWLGGAGTDGEESLPRGFDITYRQQYRR